MRVKATQEILNALSAVHQVGDKLKKGESTTTECPYCKAELVVCKSSYNGHLNAKCTKCKFVLME